MEWLRLIFTGSFSAGKTPTLLLAVAIAASKLLTDRLLLPSKLPSDSVKPNSSPKLKPDFFLFQSEKFNYFIETKNS